ncbi:MAG: hypothetical protein HY899_11610 [Deltaproteobacteria bacterium]|nr:hypothetical protein [Deltaproteobacteria bacterium]
MVVMPPACARAIARLRIRVGACWFVVAVSLPAVVAVGACTPTRFRLSPYRESRGAAQELASRARIACAALRGSEDLPPHPFTTDGCSMSPDGTWGQCCIEHDLAYWCGGGAPARRLADRRLRQCIVATRGSTLLGWLAYATTRLGGSPWLPFPWRWGYGWDSWRGYDRDGPALGRCASWPGEKTAAPAPQTTRAPRPLDIYAAI